MGIVSAFGRDLRFAVRQLRQTPIVSGVALLSLALGIGANVAIFSLVNALMLKALPVHEPDRLALLGVRVDARRRIRRSPIRSGSTSATTQDIFAGLTVTGGARFNLNAGGESRPVTGLFVNGQYFNALGVTPIVGRTFSTEDDRRGGGPDGPVAVLSYGFWQREFGGDPAAVGRSIALDGHPFTVIGVTPRDFFGVQVGREFDVAVPLGTEPIIRGTESSLDRRSNWWLTIIARLSPGQTLEQAQSRLRALQPQLREATMPQDWRPQDQATYIKEPLILAPAATGISSLRTRYSQPLYVLLGIVGLVLTIACANMANLLLAQSVARRRELAVRLSLGAGRWQLVRQLLVESIMLSLLGAGGRTGDRLMGQPGAGLDAVDPHQPGRPRPVDGLARASASRRRSACHRPAVRGVPGATRHHGGSRRCLARSLAWRRQRRRTLQRRPRARRAAGGAVVRAGVRVDAVRAHAGRPHVAGHGLPGRARADCRPRPAAHRASATRRAHRRLRTDPRRRGRGAGHRGRVRVVRHAGQRQHVEPAHHGARV